jgi:hypothetical protein
MKGITEDKRKPASFVLISWLRQNVVMFTGSNARKPGRLQRIKLLALRDRGKNPLIAR